MVVDQRVVIGSTTNGRKEFAVKALVEAPPIDWRIVVAILALGAGAYYVLTKRT